MADELLRCAEEIRMLSAPDQLRLAADLLDAGRDDVAAPIVRRVSDELHLAVVLARRG